MIRTRLQSLARRALLRALRAWGDRQTRRHTRRYTGPVSVGLTTRYVGRRVRVDYDPPRGSGWHGEGRLEASEPWESPVYQVLLLDPAHRDGDPTPSSARLLMPLDARVEVLP